MKKVITSIIFLFLLSIPLIASSFENEPDGFRGVKWGSDISEAEDMVFYGNIGADMQMYIRQNDELRIGNATIERIGYVYRNKKLSSVILDIKDYLNWVALRDSVFEKFGRGSQENRFIEDYDWHGPATTISLKYNEVTEKGRLIFLSTKDMNSRNERYRQKAKEGAEKGF